MNETQNQYPRRVWINDEEKIISFHPEDGYVEKLLQTEQDYVLFIISHGGNGYKFQ